MSDKRGASPIISQIVLSWAKYLTAIGILLLFVGCSEGMAEDRKLIDPNMELVKVRIGNLDFDVPLGYLYEDNIWTRGEWPVPKKERTSQPSVTLLVYLEGMRPWSKELAEEFKIPGNLKISRMTVKGDYPADWLRNYLQYHKPTQRPSSEFGDLPELAGFTSDHDKKKFYYLMPEFEKKPSFIIRCSRINPDSRFCEVTFTYRSFVVVRYLIPIVRLREWKTIHEDVTHMLNTFVKN